MIKIEEQNIYIYKIIYIFIEHSREELSS